MCSSDLKRGPLFIAVRGPLTIVASLVAEHRLRAFFFTALNPGEFSKNPLQSGSCPLELAHPVLVITLERYSEQKDGAGHLELHQPLAEGTPSTAVRIKPISRDCGKDHRKPSKRKLPVQELKPLETAQTKCEENQ